MEQRLEALDQGRENSLVCLECESHLLRQFGMFNECAGDSESPTGIALNLNELIFAFGGQSTVTLE